MSNIGSYESRLPGFDWSVAEKELGYPENGIHNIAYYCVDRHCAQGRGAKLAMIWEGHTGEVKRFTFDDLKIHTNAFATFLERAGDRAGRADLPLHGQDPRAVHLLPRRAQDGRRRATALLGLRRGLALHAARRREDLGDHHEQEAREEGPPDPRHASVAAPHHRRRRRGDEARGARDRLLLREGPARRDGADPSRHARDAVGPPLHFRHDGQAEGRASRARLAAFAVPDLQVGAGRQRRTTSTGARPIPVGSPGPRTASSGRGATA